jgi:hypothetical protein
MSPQSNGNTFTKQFVGNLRGQSDPVPVRVDTTLRIMTEETAREVREYISEATAVPHYVFNGATNLPLHPSLNAYGRHYFTW